MPSVADPAVAAITVVIVDDHLLMANTVADALATMADITVLGVADSCANGLAAVIRHQPDLVLLDQRLPDGVGTDAIPALLAERPQMKVLLVTGVASDEIAVTAIERGASGVIAKGRRLDDLVRAIRAAIQDEVVISADVLRRLLPAPAHGGTSRDSDLTERERKVLSLLIAGSSTAEVADALGVTPATATTYLRSGIVKLGVPTLPGATDRTTRAHVAVTP